MSVAVALHAISVRLGGRLVIDRLTATLATAGVTAVIGPNGAGKSVMLRVIDGLIAPESGEVRLGEGPLGEGQRPVRRSLVFQRTALVRASVLGNVALALAPLGVPRRDARDRAMVALRRVGLGGRASDAARRLSGGEQQRLALARAWVTEPNLLLLDEPTANLDPGATEEVETLVRTIARAGTKVVLVSHNLGQVARLSDDVLVLTGGRSVEHGPTRRVLSEPATPEARAYLNGELPWTFAAAS